MSDSECAILHHRLQEESRIMMNDYDTFFGTYCQWLLNHNISIECYKDILCQISGIDSLQCDIKLLEDRETEINKAEEHQKLHRIVKDYVNWLNYYLLEVIIDRTAQKIGITQEDFKVKVAEYKNRLHLFCERCIYECPFPPEKDISDEINRYLCIKVVMDKKYVDLQLNVIRNFHGSLIKALGLFPHTLKLCHVCEGCVEILYTIPTSIHATLFPLHEGTLLKLEPLGIVKICTQGYVAERKNTSDNFDQVKCFNAEPLTIMYN